MKAMHYGLALLCSLMFLVPYNQEDAHRASR